MRLIDADALTDELVAIQDATYMSTCTSVDECNGKRWMIARAIDAVKDTPEIDAAPVMRGEWIAEQKGAEYCEFRCSACDGSVGQTDQFDETEVKQFSEWYKYCPACGAKMEDA